MGPPLARVISLSSRVDEGQIYVLHKMDIVDATP